MRASLGASVVVLVAAAVLAACASDERPAGTDSIQGALADTGAAAGGMVGMEGMQRMGGGTMMERMQAHMRMVDGVGADSMRALLPMHRQMVANMISEMNREMRAMNMTGDASWSATMDSVRQDLVRLPEMSIAELGEFMPEHRTRVMRLMDSHRAMMQSMRR